MLRIRDLELGTVPRVAAVFSDAELRAHAPLARAFADLIELRVDRFARHDPAHVAEVCREARGPGLPVIATVRAAAEGGEADLDDARRLALFESLLAEADAFDVELRSKICPPVLAAARAAGKPVIASYHDFAATPRDGDLLRLIEEGAASGADAIKLATMAHTAGDLDRMLGVLRAHRGRNLILIAMGPHGVASRVFFPLFGSLLTYACTESAVAPGQLSLADLDRELRLYSPEVAAARAARGSA